MIKTLLNKWRALRHKRHYDRGHRWVMDNIDKHDLDTMAGIVEANALFSKTPGELAYDRGARAAVLKLKSRRREFTKIIEACSSPGRFGSNPPPTYARPPAPPAPPVVMRMVSKGREDYGQTVQSRAIPAAPKGDDMAFWPTQQMMRVAEPADAPAVRSGCGGDFAGAGGGGSWGDSPSGDSGSYGGTSD